MVSGRELPEQLYRQSTPVVKESALRSLKIQESRTMKNLIMLMKKVTFGEFKKKTIFSSRRY